MKVFVITLADAAERQENAARQLRAASIEFQFVPAVGGEDAVNSDVCNVDEREFLLSTGRKVTPGEIGRFVSHRLVWKMCTNLNEPILVMEDDFLLADHFNLAVRLVMENVREYGLIGLQQEGDAKKRRVQRLGRFTLWRYTKAPSVATCYAISPLIAGKLVEFADVISAPVDLYLKRSWRHGQQMFGISPYAVSPTDLSRDVQIEDEMESRRRLAAKNKRITNRVREWFKSCAQSLTQSERA